MSHSTFSTGTPENNSTASTQSVTVTGVSPGLKSVDGTVEAVVRLEKVSVPRTASAEQTVDTLRARAFQSQEQLVAFAEKRDGITVKNRFWLANAVLVEINTDQVSPSALLDVENVRGIHRNFKVKLPNPTNGSAAGTQPASTDASAGVDSTWGVSQVNATEVWKEYNTRGGGVKIAVLDTGVDISHPDIDLYTNNSSDPTYPGGWAEFDSDGNRVVGSEPHDTASHGTHTSGTATGGNASGEYIGVAPNASLMHGLVLPGGRGSFAQILGGMQWAVSNNADVMSMSLGAGGYYPVFIEPIRNAQNADTVVVAAAGNSGPDTIGSPGAVYEAITVGATGGEYITDGRYNMSRVDPRAISAFSSGTIVDTSSDWGDAAPSSYPATYVLPDVVAPGYAVKSSVPGGQYAKYPGTSMATPHVAGVVALMEAASNGSSTPAELKNALYQSAWKPKHCDPSCAYGRNDSRYGTGIVDAYTATTLLVDGKTTVSGSVTDASGNAIPNVDVRVGWKYTPTDKSGAFSVPIAGGNYTVTADAFGYARGSTTVSVADGETVSTTVTLNKSAEAKQTSTFPDGFQSGTDATVTFQGMHVQEVGVEVNGDYNISEVTVKVDGMEVDANTNRTWFNDQNGDIPVTVTPPAGTSGNFSLTVTFMGHNGSTTLTTNTTEVFQEPVNVGVVANNDWPMDRNASRVKQLAADLETQLPVHYKTTVIYGVENATKQAKNYDVLVVNNLSESRSKIKRFIEVTKTSNTGVVWLGQAGAPSNAVTRYSDVTGNPEVVGDRAGAYKPVGLLVRPTASNHSIFDGVNATYKDKYVMLEDAQTYHQWLKGVDMRKIGTAAYAEESFFGVNTRETGVGIAVDELERTALLPQLGYAYYMGNPTRNRGYDAAGKQILANTVQWASKDSPVSLRPSAPRRKGIDDPDDPTRSETPDLGQPDHVKPGENISVTFEARNLQELTVDVDSEFSTLTEDDLTLWVNGERVAFNETLTYNSTSFRGLTVTVGTNASATGDVSLDYTLVADGETISGSTGRTSVYEAPVRVPEDAKTLQGAVNLVEPGDTIVVGEGTYKPVHVYSAGKWNITIKSADGATPTIVSSAKRGSKYRRPAVRVSTDDVTVRGFRLNLSGNEWDAGVQVYAKHLSDRETIHHPTAPDSIVTGFENVTVANVRVQGGDFGVDAGSRSHAPGMTVRDVTVNGSTIGIAIGSPNGVVSDVTVTNTTNAIVVDEATNVAVRNSHVAHVTTGVRIGSMVEDVTVANNTIVDAKTGVSGKLFAERARVTNNAIRNASVGIKLEGANQRANDATNYRVTMNDVDAGVGVKLTHPPVGDDANASSVTLRFNDLTDTKIAVNNELATVLDARLNYYGENGPGRQSFNGKVVMEPFLAVSPEKAASEVDQLAKTRHWAVDMSLESGKTYTVGVPGPAAGTIDDMFTDFKGVIYGYDESTQTWTQLTGDDTVSSLDAMLVIPKTDTRVVMTFARDDSKPDAPDQHALSEGWNFVAAPEAANVSQAFGYTSDPVAVVSNHFTAPTVGVGPRSEINGSHQLGRDDASKSVNPFNGYFVFVEGDGYMPAYLGENKPMSHMYDELGIERPEFGNVSMNANVDPALRHAITASIHEEVVRAPPEKRDELRSAVRQAVWGAVRNSTGESTAMRVKKVQLAAEKAAQEFLASMEADSGDSQDRIASPTTHAGIRGVA